MVATNRSGGNGLCVLSADNPVSTTLFSTGLPESEVLGECICRLVFCPSDVVVAVICFSRVENEEL